MFRGTIELEIYRSPGRKFGFPPVPRFASRATIIVPQNQSESMSFATLISAHGCSVVIPNVPQCSAAHQRIRFEKTNPPRTGPKVAHPPFNQRRWTPVASDRAKRGACGRSWMSVERDLKKRTHRGSDQRRFVTTKGHPNDKIAPRWPCQAIPDGRGRQNLSIVRTVDRMICQSVSRRLGASPVKEFLCLMLGVS